MSITGFARRRRALAAEAETENVEKAEKAGTGDPDVTGGKPPKDTAKPGRRKRGALRKESP